MRRPRPLVIVLIALLLLVVAGAIAVRLLLGGDHIKAAIEAQASAALGRPVAIRTAVPRLFPRVSLDLDDIAVGEKREITIERVRLSTGLRALFGRRVEDAQVSVEGSQIDVRWALALLRVLTTPSATPAPTATSPYALTIVSITSISLRDVTLLAGPHSLRVEMDSSMIGADRFAVRRLHARSELDTGSNRTNTETAPSSEFTASGEVDSLTKRTGTFAIDAESLDLDALMAFLTAATPSGSQVGADITAAPAPPPPSYNIKSG
jgi:hypothetical protein